MICTVDHENINHPIFAFNTHATAFLAVSGLTDGANLSPSILLTPSIKSSCLAVEPLPRQVLTASIPALYRSSCVPYALGVSFIRVCNETYTISEA